MQCKTSLYREAERAVELERCRDRRQDESEETVYEENEKPVTLRSSEVTGWAAAAAAALALHTFCFFFHFSIRTKKAPRKTLMCVDSLQRMRLGETDVFYAIIIIIINETIPTRT